MRLEKAFWISLISLIVFGVTAIVTQAQTSAPKPEATSDEVTVTIPYRFQAGEKKDLDKGEYKIRLSGAKAEIFKAPNDPSKVELRVGVNQFPFGEPGKETKVILHPAGSDHILNEIWIQGKSYYYKVAKTTIEPFQAAVPGDAISAKDAVALNAKYEQVPVAGVSNNTPAKLASN